VFYTVGFKLAEGKGLREGRDSKELWKSVDKLKARFSSGASYGLRKLEALSGWWPLARKVRPFHIDTAP